MPDWFRDQVDRMTAPDLPAFAPGEALGGQSSATTRRRSRRSRSRSSKPSGENHPLSDVWD
jgi:hypothetical protein